MTARVLIVDDEVPNLTTFQRVFRKHFDLQLASSGERALELLAQHEFDVVLSDFGMPVMTGAELVARARELQSVAFVMVTGYMNHPEVIELEASGAVFAIVPKPWERATILDVVARAAEHTLASRPARASG